MEYTVIIWNYMVIIYNYNYIIICNYMVFISLCNMRSIWDPCGMHMHSWFIPSCFKLSAQCINLIDDGNTRTAVCHSQRISLFALPLTASFALPFAFTKTFLTKKLHFLQASIVLSYASHIQKIIDFFFKSAICQLVELYLFMTVYIPSNCMCFL